MKFGQGIASKQAKIILVTAFFIGGISALVQLYVDMQQVRSSFLGSIDRSISVYTPNLQEAVYNLDAQQAQGIVNNLTQDPLFLTAAIYDDFGDRMAYIARGESVSDSIFGKLGYKILQIKDHYEQHISIPSNTESKAKLVLTLDRVYISKGLVKRAMTLLLLGLVSTIVLSLVLFFVFYKFLSKPIKRISHWVAGLDNGSNHITLPYAKPDELGDLARSVADIWRKKDYANQQVMRLAYYDPLTELANRRMFVEKLDITLEEIEQNKGVGVVMYLDIDRFKTINDSLGHPVGDQLLIIIAKRLRNVLPDNATIARFGGDEFVVLIPLFENYSDQGIEKSMSLAKGIIEAISAPARVGRNLIHCSTSIGITLFPLQNDTSSNILRRADTALYRVKADGRNGYKFYDASMQEEAKARWELEEGLHDAIRRRQLELWLQPQISNKNIITGAEVLLRWRHPEKGMISPVEFIAVAEESGQISAIEEWVLEESLKLLSNWAAIGLPKTFKHLAVNISPAHFMQVDFVDRILPMLDRHERHGIELEFEITENLLIDNFKQASNTMKQLQAAGVSFAIDDFGTGYSSLRYLNQLPLNILKIDRSFVDKIENTDEAAIVDVILMTAKKLGLEVIAEGVETSLQQRLLQQRGCHLYQGFYFSKPVHHQAFYDMLTEHGGRISTD